MTKKAVVASGKRKTAIARATVKPCNGVIRINSVPIDVYEPEYSRLYIQELLNIIPEDILSNVNISVKVRGGGIMGQAEAVRIAIARALVEYTSSSELKNIFLEYTRVVLSGDSRRREPKKFGGRGARARFQKSYR